MVCPGAVSAQKVTLDPSVVKPSPDLNTIKTQLRSGVTLGRKVLEELRASPTDDSIPMDPKVIQDARNTYALIRAAREGMEFRKDRQKVPDPVFDLGFKRVTDAWGLSRTAAEPNNWTGQRQAYLEASSRDLRRALQLVEQALLILP
jgi:hypothetical protein